MQIQWEILAGFRFFLALVVTCAHLRHFVPQNDVLIVLKEFSGFSAVLGFLLISGFSIAHSASRNIRGFYQRRIVRIYPLYFCSILISIVPFIVSGSNKFTSFDNTEYVKPTLLNVVGNLFFMQNIIFNPLPSNGVVWTLGVEVLCYLLTPFLIRLSFNKLITLITFSSGSFLIYCLVDNPFRSDIAFLRAGLPLLLLAWAWLLGFLLYLYPNAVLPKYLIVVLGCFLLNFTGYGGEAKLYVFTYIIVALILIIPLSIRLPERFSIVLNYLGDISYPLYLFHSFAFILGYFFLSMEDSLSLLLLSIGVSVIFYHLVDVPVRRSSKLVKPKLSK